MKQTDALRMLSELAADQWGLVTTAQAKAADVRAVTILRLVEAGLLEAVGRGVYLIAGAVQPRHLSIKVAWLRLEPDLPAWQRQSADLRGGVISYGSACELHMLGDLPTSTVEISVPRRRTTRDPSVRLHRSEVEPTEIVLVDGLPVTTAERTIVDLLKARVDGAHLGGVIVDADRKGLISQHSLAHRVAPFARAYGLRSAASGQDVLDYLAEQADARLPLEEAVRLRQEGMEQGYTMAIAHIAALDPTNIQIVEVIRKLVELHPSHGVNVSPSIRPSCSSPQRPSPVSRGRKASEEAE